MMPRVAFGNVHRYLYCHRGCHSTMTSLSQRRPILRQGKVRCSPECSAPLAATTPARCKRISQTAIWKMLYTIHRSLRQPTVAHWINERAFVRIASSGLSASSNTNWRRSAMKAVVLHEYGGPENLKFEDNIPDPQVSGDTVLIATAAASVNPIDWKIRSGARHKDFPQT